MPAYLEVLPVYLHIAASVAFAINVEFGRQTRGVFNVIKAMDNAVLVVVVLLNLSLCIVVKWWYGLVFAGVYMLGGSILNGLLFRLFDHHIHLHLYTYRVMTFALDSFIIYSLAKVIYMIW